MTVSARKNVITDLSDTLHLVERQDGFWLYDDTRSMNVAIREKTRDAALLCALQHYQKRLQEVEKEYASLKAKVEVALKQFRTEEDDGRDW